MEQIISQTLNRKDLGHNKLFNTTDLRSKEKDQTKTKQTKPANSRSPTKKTKLADIQFECDTSISLSSDSEPTRKTPSPSKPAAKIFDTKRTPEEFERQVRRSTRTRIGTLTGKFGNAIPINNIEDQGLSKNVVCQVQIIPKPEHSDKPGTTSRDEPPEVISISSSIECTDIQMEPQTPEEIRASSQQKDTLTPTSNETNLDTASPP